MLDEYLEKNIQNKLELFNILHSNEAITAKELIGSFTLSATGVYSLLEELKADFSGLAEIEKSVKGFELEVKEGVSVLQLLHRIYRNSNVLRCIRFLILNDKNKSFQEFMDKEYMTKSTAYRVRQNCAAYLRAAGLKIQGSRVTGEEYRIRFLIALLYYKYGVECYKITREDIDMTRRFILVTNSSVDREYLECTGNEYGYFEILFILAWKRKRYLKEFAASDQLEACKKIWVYEEMKKALQKFFEPSTGIQFEERDYDYLYLVYCCTNSCLFADQWNDERIAQVHEIVFSDPAFLDLLERFGKRFGEEIKNFHALRATLVYFYKKCFMGLQCIIPDKNFYLDSRKSFLSQKVVKTITEILQDWRQENQIQYSMDKNHIFYLSLQLERIIRRITKPVSVLVVSDLTAELEIMILYLTKFFAPERVKITPFLINAKNRKDMYEKENNVVVFNKRFRHIIDTLQMEEKNILVPVTVELNSREMIAIQKAIMKYESENFLEFVKDI